MTRQAASVPVLRAATDADRAGWQAFLAASPAGDFLHDWGWGAVAAFDGEPQHRFALVEGDELVAIVAAQHRRLPLARASWYVPHGPVLDYTHPRAAPRLRAMVDGLREAAREARAIAVTLEPRLEAGDPALAIFRRVGVRPAGGTRQVGQTRLVTLADEEALLAGMDKDTRYAVRRAEREGVIVSVTDDPDDVAAVERLYELVVETQRRAGFELPSRARYRVAWQGLAGERHAAILEARREEELLASGMLVIEGDRSFYLFSGSRREAQGEPKRYASYALQWAMMRHAREAGVRCHDLWGVAPAGAGADHPWYGVGLFKKGFGGREVTWAGSWDIVVDRPLYAVRLAAGIARRPAQAVRHGSGAARRFFSSGAGGS